MAHHSTIGAFSEDQAARLSGVSINQLRRWDSDGFFRASFGVREKRVPFGRIYSFRDIVSLRVLNDLRNEKKIPLSHLRKVALELSHLGDSKWTATTLYVLGKRVVFHDPRTSRKREIVSGQTVMELALRVVIASTRRALADLNDRADQVGKVVTMRFTSQNEPVIAGTRIPVRSVREFAGAGYSHSQIMTEFPQLTEADILAALRYTAETLAA